MALPPEFMATTRSPCAELPLELDEDELLELEELEEELDALVELEELLELLLELLLSLPQPTNHMLVATSARDKARLFVIDFFMM
jgi:hypothetical protein